MSDQTSRKFTCPGCGRHFAWKPELAGRRVSCKCGNVFVAEEPPDEETYDMVNEPELPVAPAVSIAKAEPVLTYESKEVVKEETRKKRRKLFEEWRIQELWLPIALVVLGILVKLGLKFEHSMTGPSRGVVLMMLVAFGTGFNVLLMLAGYMISARLTDLEPAPMIQIVVKLGIIFVTATSAGGLLASLGRFDSMGIMVGVCAVFLIYWILFALMFKSGLMETMTSVTIISIIQSVLNLGLWKV